MRFFRFDAEKAKEIQQFESKGIGCTPILRQEGWLQVGCFHFAPGSVLGLHSAICPQLFMVVAGDGWVRAETTARFPVRAGQAVFWTRGERHESGSDTGMTVMVFEGSEMDPEPWMEEIEGRG
ncbi:cupin domain-containing protein [Salinithrix halophila]|uniref:Cupin domain-containing protein n=1 Tax=Salinithrix halophila TaxID=1485204 RepID=A0ABV8J960_9BACL